MLRPAIGETVAAMRRVLASAGVQPADLSAILLVGGSSRIPLVSELLSGEFGRPLALDNHPKHDVALGAATPATPAADPRPAEPAPDAVPIPGTAEAAAPEDTVVSPAATTTDEPPTPAGPSPDWRPPAVVGPQHVGPPPADGPEAPTTERRRRRLAPSLLVVTFLMIVAGDRGDRLVVVGRDGAPGGGRLERCLPTVRPGERRSRTAGGVRTRDERRGCHRRHARPVRRHPHRHVQRPGHPDLPRGQPGQGRGLGDRHGPAARAGRPLPRLADPGDAAYRHCRHQPRLPRRQCHGVPVGASGGHGSARRRAGPPPRPLLLRQPARRAEPADVGSRTRAWPGTASRTTRSP